MLSRNKLTFNSRFTRITVYLSVLYGRLLPRNICP